MDKSSGQNQVAQLFYECAVVFDQQRELTKLLGIFTDTSSYTIFVLSCSVSGSPAPEVESWHLFDNGLHSFFTFIAN